LCSPWIFRKKVKMSKQFAGKLVGKVKQTRGMSIPDRLMMWAVWNVKTGCLEWEGRRSACGYGVLKIGHQLKTAHRLSFKYFYRIDIPEGKFVCHKCDNRKCISPEHLFLGTAKDNAHDMIRKGRAVWQKKKTS